MPRLLLTDRAIRSLKPADHRTEYFDKKLPCFGLRVSGGTKSFIVLYRYGRRLRRFTLGRYPHLSLADARKRARDALHDSAHGKDPAAQKVAERHAETVGELADLYIEKHAKRKKRSWREDERIIDREIRPAWKVLPAKAIKRRDVEDLIDKIADRGSPVMANRTLALVRKMFNFAVTKDIVELNPCSKLTAPGVEQKRDRVLSEDEIKSILNACNDEPRWVADAIALSLHTAQRKVEVLGMPWNEVDLSGGWWTISADRAKNGLAHRVPLSAQVLRILKERRLQAAGSRFVFPGARDDCSVTTIQKPLDRIRETSKVEFRLHDLRRTAASHMAGMGIARLTVSKILNHAEPGVTAIYDRHSYDSEKREALTRWSDRLQEILTAEDARAEVQADGR